MIGNGSGVDADGRFWLSHSKPREKWAKELSSFDSRKIDLQKQKIQEVNLLEQRVVEATGLGMVYTSGDHRKTASYSSFLRVRVMQAHPLEHLPCVVIKEVRFVHRACILMLTFALWVYHTPISKNFILDYYDIWQAIVLSFTSTIALNLEDITYLDFLFHEIIDLLMQGLIETAGASGRIGDEEASLVPLCVVPNVEIEAKGCLVNEEMGYISAPVNVQPMVVYRFVQVGGMYTWGYVDASIFSTRKYKSRDEPHRKDLHILIFVFYRTIQSGSSMQEKE